MTRDSLRFWAWTALILLAVLPWTGFQSHAHWQRVAWIPFVSPPVKVRDVLVNILLYVPWGYFYVRQKRADRKVGPSDPLMPERLRWPWIVIVSAAILSLTSEAAQLYSHGRFPSATDTTCNVLGAFVGARYARMKSERSI